MTRPPAMGGRLFGVLAGIKPLQGVTERVCSGSREFIYVAQGLFKIAAPPVHFMGGPGFG
jgi:hypothetical protein